MIEARLAEKRKLAIAFAERQFTRMVRAEARLTTTYLRRGRSRTSVDHLHAKRRNILAHILAAEVQKQLAGSLAYLCTLGMTTFAHELQQSIVAAAMVAKDAAKKKAIRRFVEATRRADA